MKQRQFWLAIPTAVLTMLLGATGAAAAPLNAADFAADCNDDGQVLVSGRTVYRGGSGIITGDCSVVHSPGATLILRNVNLIAGGNLVAISSKQDASIRVVNSRIVAGGYLELTAGCCGGYPDGPEENGTVVIRRSELTGLAIQLMASFDYPDGTVIVQDSSLTATGPLGVQIRASDLVGVNGRIRVSGTTISSAGDVLIRTGKTGRTAVWRSSFTATGDVTIATGTGGTCLSTMNTPSTPCSS